MRHENRFSTHEEGRLKAPASRPDRNTESEDITTELKKNLKVFKGTRKLNYELSKIKNHVFNSLVKIDAKHSLLIPIK